MTRINTNVSSLIAQNTLARSNVDLQTALTRLSTGLRINVGKDDPAGLIASEALRSDIVSASKAVANSERANQVIATADSALGQVSQLLNDIRALVTEAANTGALSEEQIAANQLQVDSSLEAINRIAQTTSFQGRRLLDGSLDFIVSGSTPTVSELKIDQANLGASGSVAVAVDITAAATQASITATVPTSVAAAKASATIKFTEAVGVYDQVVITAATAGADFNDIDVVFVEDSGLDGSSAIANFNGTDTLTVYISDYADTTVADIASAITGLAEFDATSSSVGGADGDFNSGFNAAGTLGTTAGGADASTGLTEDLTFEIRGAKGAEVFTFEAGTTGSQIEAAIDLVSDATGITASFAAGTLTLSSSDYGSDAFVEIDVVTEGGATPFTTSLSGSRDEGTDIEASVNGFTASGDGNSLSINTGTLDLSLTVADGSSTDVSFTITGGGALFQLGPDVVSNQQARIGLQSVNSTRLGGPSGRLYELASGGARALATDSTGAAAIVDEAISAVTGLRGRLGAFQRTTLDTNIASLNDTLANLTEAESQIRDADFAEETARLTRAQILVQSGTAVLQIANSNPQNALALLQ